MRTETYQAPQEPQLADNSGGFDGGNRYHWALIDELEPDGLSDGTVSGVISGAAAGLAAGVILGGEMNKGMVARHQLAAVRSDTPAIERGILNRTRAETTEVYGIAIGSVLLIAVAGGVVGNKVGPICSKLRNKLKRI